MHAYVLCTACGNPLVGEVAEAYRVLRQQMMEAKLARAGASANPAAAWYGGGIPRALTEQVPQIGAVSLRDPETGAEPDAELGAILDALGLDAHFPCCRTTLMCNLDLRDVL